MSSRTLKTHLAAAIRRMLRPVVRQLIAHGVTFPAVSEMLRQLYVEVAETQFTLPFKRQTDSRLALVTGLSRKEIAQIRQAKTPTDDLPDVEDTPVTRVLGRWMAGPPYASPDGVPRRLAYESPDPSVATFHRLAGDVETDVTVRALLDELIRLGLVEWESDGGVSLRQPGNIAAATDVEGKMALLGSDPGELFQSIMHNIETPDRPWFQRKVVYDNVGAEALAQLQEEARQLGDEFIRRANALLSSYDRDRHGEAPGGARSRVVLGAYYFEERAEQVEMGQNTRGYAAPPGRIRRSR